MGKGIGGDCSKGRGLKKRAGLERGWAEPKRWGGN